MGKNKKPISRMKVGSTKKVPKEVVNPNSFLSKHPVWRFNRSDNEHSKWSIQHNCNINEQVLGKLISFEGMTWQDIQSAAGGRNKGTNHHFIDVEDLIIEAQSRLVELRIQYDQLFSLRLTSRERLFGILEDGIYHILWYDSKHEICPSKK